VTDNPVSQTTDIRAVLAALSADGLVQCILDQSDAITEFNRSELKLRSALVRIADLIPDSTHEGVGDIAREALKLA